MISSFPLNRWLISNLTNTYTRRVEVQSCSISCIKRQEHPFHQCTILEFLVRGRSIFNFSDRRSFLQHGHIKSSCSWLVHPWRYIFLEDGHIVFVLIVFNRLLSKQRWRAWKTSSTILKNRLKAFSGVDSAGGKKSRASYSQYG